MAGLPGLPSTTVTAAFFAVDPVPVSPQTRHAVALMQVRLAPLKPLIVCRWAGRPVFGLSGNFDDAACSAWGAGKGRLGA
jgi:hypothetical protein